MASRVTLATIEAAAIEAICASPPMTDSAGKASVGGSLPSTSTKAGASASAATARRIASSVAWRMLIVSISAAVALAMPMASADCAISANSSSRRAGVRFFESSSPSGTACGSRITAAATTGPASGPRPTSSTPASGQRPSAMAFVSRWKWAVMGGAYADSRQSP